MTEGCYLKPVMTPVGWVAGIWLTALDLHLSHTGAKLSTTAESQIQNQLVPRMKFTAQMFKMIPSFNQLR